MSEKEVKELIRQLEKVAIPILDGQKKEDVYGSVRNLFCAMLLNIFGLEEKCCCRLIDCLDEWVHINVSKLQMEKEKTG